MLGRAYINVGNRVVGEVLVDGDQARSDGGVLAPVLVFPVQIELAPQPEGRQVALVRLDVTLLVGQGASVRRLGDGATLWGVGGGNGVWCSVPGSTARRGAELRFDLSSERVRLLEDEASRLGRGEVAFELRFSATTAFVASTHDVPSDRHPVPSAMGLVSQLLPFWETNVSPVGVGVSRERWAEAVLPGLGVDRVRLVGVRLPGPGDLVAREAVRIVDNARSAYDSGGYREAVGLCRDLRHLVEQRLGATGKEPVARKVADRLGWQQDSGAYQYLDGSWKALAVLTNEARHLNGQRITAADARAVVLHTAVLVEYLAALLAPDRL